MLLDGAQQIFDLPMATYSTGDNPLQFKHLTGALYITITNTASVPLTLQSVTVVSTKYRQSGTKSINFKGIETITATTAGGGETNRSVTMLFDMEYTLANNESVRVMIRSS